MSQAHHGYYENAHLPEETCWCQPFVGPSDAPYIAGLAFHRSHPGQLFWHHGEQGPELPPLCNSHIDMARGRDFSAEAIVICTPTSRDARDSALRSLYLASRRPPAAPGAGMCAFKFSNVPVAEHIAQIRKLYPGSYTLAFDPNGEPMHPGLELKADRGNPYIARNPKDQYLAAAEQAMGRISPHRSRIRKGKLVRFRRKSHKRVIDPGPSPAAAIKQHARMMRRLPKQALAPDVLEANRKEHGARSVDHRNALAHRSNAARRAKLASRRR